jgi:hypothetical protein
MRSNLNVAGNDPIRQHLPSKKEFEAPIAAPKDSGVRIYRMPDRSTSEPSGELITAAVMSSRENIVAKRKSQFRRPLLLSRLYHNVLYGPIHGVEQGSGFT